MGQRLVVRLTGHTEAYLANHCSDRRYSKKNKLRKAMEGRGRARNIQNPLRLSYSSGHSLSFHYVFCHPCDVVPKQTPILPHNMFGGIDQLSERQPPCLDSKRVEPTHMMFPIVNDIATLWVAQSILTSWLHDAAFPSLRHGSDFRKTTLPQSLSGPCPLCLDKCRGACTIRDRSSQFSH